MFTKAMMSGVFASVGQSTPSLTTLTVKMWGAGGAYCVQTGAYGGAGGYAQFDVDVPSGTALYLVVGQAGVRQVGGRRYGEGGNGRGDSHPWSASGGGLTGVFMSTFSTGMSSGHVMGVAGGGGGGGNGKGGDAGGSSGQAGQGPYGNGGGGTSSSGGSAGAYAGGTAPQDGSFLRGGDGNVGEAGGGGGGGYYGGGGGGYDSAPSAGGGGGGSSYTAGASGYTTSNVTNTLGGGSAQENHGRIEITAGGTTTVFNYTGGEQTYVVPLVLPMVTLTGNAFFNPSSGYTISSSGGTNNQARRNSSSSWAFGALIDYAMTTGKYVATFQVNALSGANRAQFGVADGAGTTNFLANNSAGEGGVDSQTFSTGYGTGQQITIKFNADTKVVEVLQNGVSQGTQTVTGSTHYFCFQEYDATGQVTLINDGVDYPDHTKIAP